MERIKSYLPHITALLIFISLSSVYFYPVFQGYRIKQADIKLHKGMSHELRSHKDKFGEAPLWVGNMFGGMPTYQISAIDFDGNLISYLHQALRKWVPYPVSLLVLYMIGFYILLMCLKIDYRLAIIGSIAFAFSSYFIVIIEAGHTSKGFALAYMPAIIGGYLLTTRRNLKIGFLLTALFVALQLQANHLQITYYTMILLLVIFLSDVVFAFKSGEIQNFLKKIALLVLAAVLGILPNIGNTLLTYEYSKSSTRSPSELTIEPDGSSNKKVSSTGLEKDYITQWSYGIGESFTLMMPDFKGGASGAIIGDEEAIKKIQREDVEFFNFMVEKYQKEGWYVNTYWGNMPFTSGPVYAGILICFMAFLALIYVEDRLKYGLIIAGGLTLALSWGKNFMPLTEFFIDYFPVYNKFRAVTMILVIVEIVLPILALMFLTKFINNRDEILKNKKRLLISSAIFIGTLCLMYLFPEIFNDFISNKENSKIQQWIAAEPNRANFYHSMFDKIVDYRVEVFRSDLGIRILYLLGFVAMAYLFMLNKLQKKYFLIVIGLLVWSDLWFVDKQYLNNEETQGASKRSNERFVNYTKPNTILRPFNPSQIDMAILQKELQQRPQLQNEIQSAINQKRQEIKRLTQGDITSVQFTELMRNSHYRVLNTTRKMDEDAETSYFHKNLGGYHAAKIKKFQELISFKLGIEHYQMKQAFLQGGEPLVKQLLPRMNVTNMLNTKYVIGAVKGKQGAGLAYVENPYRLGNAWFVDSIKVVENADEEILTVRDMDAGNKAVIQASEDYKGKVNFKTSSQNRIVLDNYLPNELVYSYSASGDQFIVFSEVYYKDGWKVYVNDQEVPYYKVNYILRGMPISAGSGTIVFKFEPQLYSVGKAASWISSSIFLILIIGIGFKTLKEGKVEEGSNN